MAEEKVDLEGIDDKLHKETLKYILSNLKEYVNSALHEKPKTFCFSDKLEYSARIGHEWGGGPIKKLINDRCVRRYVNSKINDHVQGSYIYSLEVHTHLFKSSSLYLHIKEL